MPADEKKIEFHDDSVSVCIRSMVRSFYHVLQAYPSIHGDINADGDIDRYYKDNVTLVFGNGMRTSLKYKGSVYDYFPLDRAHWTGETTRRQITEIIKAMKEEPKAVEYSIENNWTQKQPVHNLTLEFSWNFVKSVLDTKPRELCNPDDYSDEENMLVVPYRIVSGEYKLSLKPEEKGNQNK